MNNKVFTLKELTLISALAALVEDFEDNDSLIQAFEDIVGATNGLEQMGIQSIVRTDEEWKEAIVELLKDAVKINE